MRKISLSAKKKKRAALIEGIDNINDRFGEKDKACKLYGETVEESIPTEDEGRADRVKATVNNILNQKPEIIGQSKRIKKLVQEEFQKADEYKLFEKDLMNLDGIIKNSVAQFRNNVRKKNAPANNAPIKRSIKHISQYFGL